MLLTISSLLRSITSEAAIPESWKKDVERLKERKDVTAPALLKQKEEEIKRNLSERTLTHPNLFLRDLHRTLSYIDKNITDPTKHGLVQDLSNFSNQISSARGEEIKLPADTQNKFLTSAGRLKDDGTLLTMLQNLFNEHYNIDIRPTKRKALICIAQLLKMILMI